MLIRLQKLFINKNNFSVLTVKKVVRSTITIMTQEKISVCKKSKGETF